MALWHFAAAVLFALGTVSAVEQTSGWVLLNHHLKHPSRQHSHGPRPWQRQAEKIFSLLSEINPVNISENKQKIISGMVVSVYALMEPDLEAKKKQFNDDQATLTRKIGLVFSGTREAKTSFEKAQSLSAKLGVCYDGMKTLEAAWRECHMPANELLASLPATCGDTGRLFNFSVASKTSWPCDYAKEGESAQTCLKAFTDDVTKVEVRMDELREEWRSTKSSCERDKLSADAMKGSCGPRLQDYYTKRANCSTMSTRANLELCTFREKVSNKCDRLQEFREAKDRVAIDDQARKMDWENLGIVGCMLLEFNRTFTFTQEAADHCNATQPAYAEKIGTMDFFEQMYASQVVPDSFTCGAQTLELTDGLARDFGCNANQFLDLDIEKDSDHVDFETCKSVSAHMHPKPYASRSGKTLYVDIRVPNDKKVCNNTRDFFSALGHGFFKALPAPTDAHDTMAEWGLADKGEEACNTETQCRFVQTRATSDAKSTLSGPTCVLVPDEDIAVPSFGGGQDLSSEGLPAAFAAAEADGFLISRRVCGI